MAQVGVGVINYEGLQYERTKKNYCRTLVDSKSVDIPDFLRIRIRGSTKMLNINEPKGTKNIQPAGDRNGIRDCPIL